MCCRLPVEVTVEDLVSLGYISEGFDQGRVSLKKLAKNLQKQGIISSYRAQSSLFTLRQKPNSDCLFLDSTTRRCTVYEQRPGVCRRFPEIGPRPQYCPYVKKVEVKI
jgi:Fe-S-cluster containining protein